MNWVNNLVRSLKFRWVIFAAALFFEFHAIYQYVVYLPGKIPVTQHIGLAFLFVFLGLQGAELQRNRNAKLRDSK